MSYIVVDVEADGNLLGTNSMVCFGAVIIDKEGKLDKTFYGKTAPILIYTIQKRYLYLVLVDQSI